MGHSFMTEIESKLLLWLWSVINLLRLQENNSIMLLPVLLRWRVCFQSLHELITEWLIYFDHNRCFYYDPSATETQHQSQNLQIKKIWLSVSKSKNSAGPLLLSTFLFKLSPSLSCPHFTDYLSWLLWQQPCLTRPAAQESLHSGQEGSRLDQEDIAR